MVCGVLAVQHARLLRTLLDGRRFFSAWRSFFGRSSSLGEIWTDFYFAGTVGLGLQPAASTACVAGTAPAPL